MGGNQSTCTKQRKAPWEHASVWKMFSSVIDRQCRLTIARTCDMNPARFQLFVKLLVHYIKLSQNSNSKIWAWTLARDHFCQVRFVGLSVETIYKNRRSRGCSISWLTMSSNKLVMFVSPSPYITACSAYSCYLFTTYYQKYFRLKRIIQS